MKTLKEYYITWKRAKTRYMQNKTDENYQTLNYARDNFLTLRSKIGV
jgi:hypothetical protein